MIRLGHSWSGGERRYGRTGQAWTTDEQAWLPPKRARKAPSDKAFDLWLDQGLHAMFDEVAKEPIPEELLRLIEQDRNNK